VTLNPSELGYNPEHVLSWATSNEDPLPVMAEDLLKTGELPSRT